VAGLSACRLKRNFAGTQGALELLVIDDHDDALRPCNGALPWRFDVSAESFCQFFDF
jgi:hypothetical protein